MNYSFLPCGDSALTVCFSTEISEEANSHVTALSKVLESGKISAVKDIIPAFSSLTVIYDPCEISYSKLTRKLKGITKRMSASSGASSLLYKIPVCYDGEFAPDMENIMRHTGLDREEIIKIHTGTDYLIYMLGFLPGFAYLGGLDKRIETPRLESPRVEIPSGSVGIGGAQTGIYPVASPGGWQLIGKTPVKVYDAKREKPILYNAGDYIRFVRISPEKFAEIEKQVENGSYTAEVSEVSR